MKWIGAALAPEDYCRKHGTTCALSNWSDPKPSPGDEVRISWWSDHGHVECARGIIGKVIERRQDGRWYFTYTPYCAGKDELSEQMAVAAVRRRLDRNATAAMSALMRNDPDAIPAHVASAAYDYAFAMEDERTRRLTDAQVAAAVQEAAERIKGSQK